VESDSKSKENEPWKQHCLWLMDDKSFSHLQKFDLETFLFSYSYHWQGWQRTTPLGMFCFYFCLFFLY
jgi:hypothetical protein